MIVVVIIGILAAVAIPSYQGFQDKAKATEAKTQLSAFYSAEQAYFAENNIYSDVLSTIGIVAAPANYYFAIGFATANGVVVTSSAGVLGTAAASKVHSKCIVTAAVTGGSAAPAKFKACAQREAGTDAKYDEATDWNIDNKKKLVASKPN